MHPSVPDPKLPLGYNLADSEKACQWAVQEGFNLVKQARRAGLDVRALAQQAAARCAALVSDARQGRCSSESDRTAREEREKIEEKARALQLDVAERLRRYFDEISHVMGRLQALNPPLNAEQLQPFAEATLTDRQTTLSALDPFTRMMDLLRRWLTPGENPEKIPDVG